MPLYKNKKLTGKGPPAMLGLSHCLPWSMVQSRKCCHRTDLSNITEDEDILDEDIFE